MSSSPYQVERQLRKLHSGKAAGPDSVSSRVLKACGVHNQVFHVRLQMVPGLWKMSCLVPVPKTQCPNASKDYRPVVLTFYILKTLERLLLEELRPMVRSNLDLLQFSYQPRLGVEDAE